MSTLKTILQPTIVSRSLLFMKKKNHTPQGQLMAPTLFYPGGSPRPTPSPFTQQLSQLRPSSILPPPRLQDLRCPFYKAKTLVLHSPAHPPPLVLQHLWSQAHTAWSTPNRSAPGPWLPLQVSPTLGESPFLSSLNPNTSRLCVHALVASNALRSKLFHNPEVIPLPSFSTQHLHILQDLLLCPLVTPPLV